MFAIGASLHGGQCIPKPLAVIRITRSREATHRPEPLRAQARPIE
jgi:hypothetical protein